MGQVFEERDGRLEFAGDFETLYQVQDDPWHQSQTGDERYAAYYQKSRRHTARMLHAHMDRAKAMMCAEIGCGHGHSTRYFREMCGASWVGYDVSEAAVLKAEQLHRGVGHLEFRHGDLLIPPPEPIPDPVQFDIVLWGEVFWYLLHDIEHAVDHTTQLVAPGGLFVLSQGFLLGEQRYGAEIAHGWHGALELLLHSFRGFDLVFATHDPTGSHVLNHGLAMFRKRLP